MPSDMSFVVPIAFSSGAQKLGQPVRLSNLVVDEKSARSHPAQKNVPRILIGRQQFAPFGVAASDLEGVLRASSGGSPR